MCNNDPTLVLEVSEILATPQVPINLTTRVDYTDCSERRSVNNSECIEIQRSFSSTRTLCVCNPTIISQNGCEC